MPCVFGADYNVGSFNTWIPDREREIRRSCIATSVWGSVTECIRLGRVLGTAWAHVTIHENVARSLCAREASRRSKPRLI